MKQCTCYVRLFDQQVRFTLRWGAHALDCPSYRESGDPVDRAEDEEIRMNAIMHDWEYGEPLCPTNRSVGHA